MLTGQHGVCRLINMASTQNTTQTRAQEAAMFANITTATLISMNVTYLREYRANPTAGNLQAVKDSDAELSRRGA